MLLEVRGGRNEEPSHAAKTPGDQRRVRERSCSDSEVETFLDEVHRASRAEQLEPNLRVALEIVADDRTEEGGVDGSGHTQEPTWSLLQAAHSALGFLDLAHDPRAVVVVRTPDVREAQLTGGALQEARVQSLLQFRHLPANGRLRHPERGCSRREAAGLHDPREYEHFVEVISLAEILTSEF